MFFLYSMNSMVRIIILPLYSSSLLTWIRQLHPHKEVTELSIRIRSISMSSVVSSLVYYQKWHWSRPFSNKSPLTNFQTLTHQISLLADLHTLSNLFHYKIQKKNYSAPFNRLLPKCNDRKKQPKRPFSLGKLTNFNFRTFLKLKML